MRQRLGATARRTFRSLGVRNYRLYFSGQFISVIGTWMQTVAQGWLVLDLTGSGVALGTSVALQFLPVLALGMWGGVVADRFDKRRVLLLTQGSSAVLALTLWAMVASGEVALWHVYVLAFLSGCVHLVDMPTRQAFVTEMVGPEEVPNAVALNSAMFNSGRLIGPAAAGLLIASVGIAASFLVNAFSYLATIAALSAMHTGELFLQPPRAPERRQVRSALRYVWTTPALRSPLLLMAGIGTFGMNFVVVLPIIARYDFDGGAALYGLLTSLMAVGSLAGALAVAGNSHPTIRRQAVAGGAFGALTVVAAVAPNAATMGAVLVGSGVASIVFLATTNAYLQLKSEPFMRGRVMALYGLVFLGSTPVGGPMMGWIAEHWGARLALAIGGAVSLAAAVLAMAAALRAVPDRAGDRARSKDLTVAA